MAEGTDVGGLPEFFKDMPGTFAEKNNGFQVSTVEFRKEQHSIDYQV